MTDFTGSTVLVTGAASGIGAATARLLAEREAYRLVLADRDEAGLAALAADIACETILLPGDVADEALWDGADLAGLTHAVVNAGIAAASPIAETALAEWRRVMAVNLDGAFLALRAAMRAMAGRGGAIVVTASVAGLKAEPGTAAYAASKAGAIQLARVAAKEGVATSIRVNCIAPGGVETAIWDAVPMFAEMSERLGGRAAAFAEMGRMATPMGRFATADEIAGQIAFLLSDATAFVTGACLVADGGYSL